MWLLFDNIDKGWPTTGLKSEDFIIIRTLIDAARKIQRFFNNSDIDIQYLVYIQYYQNNPS